MKFRIRDNNKQASIKQSCDTYITTFEGNNKGNNRYINIIKYHYHIRRGIAVNYTTRRQKNVTLTWYRLSNITVYSFHTLSTFLHPIQRFF